MTDEHTDVSDATRQAEREEAAATHSPDRPPTPEEEADAAEHSVVDPEVREHYEEMIERGAEVKGEGEVS
jgi:hypothetical protein